MKNTYYITTPIYYASGNLHIGHTYTTIISDCLARFKRLQGYDTIFLTGTDEHGLKIQQNAEKASKDPKDYVDEIVDKIKELWDLFNIKYDKFVRTTDPYHIKTVQNIFETLYKNGDIYKGTYEGHYCVPCESFFTESQLENGKCPDCKRDVTLQKEEAYFFKISKYADKLLKYIEDNPHFIQPESRKNEMINNFIKPGLQDLCVSRTSFKWGIPVNFDSDHVIYVWIDALSNYISTLGYKNDEENLMESFWPADLHIVGKEIVRFHVIYWPIMLFALNLPLPKQVFGHGWLLIDGNKMSKSQGSVIDPIILSKHFPIDAIRYFLLREVTFGNDGVFNNELFILKTNADLSNLLGNLVSRTISMVEKYFGGVIPSQKEILDVDLNLINNVKNLKNIVTKNMDELKISNALSEIFNVISLSNKYIDETEPWVLGKDESKKDRLGTVLYNLCESIRVVSTLLSPFMPDTSLKIKQKLNYKLDNFDSIENFDGTESGVSINKGQNLFPRIDVEKKLEELKNS